ncbi:LLM class flavin-dependent oxidoreductase [Streptomyces sp. NBC_00391]|uniref:LLM class flavin-dependent oxidoreductase n=1 Tax=Streptomyces sp. NBC_00391 TaxID=2903647 RepID=UPI002E204394
MAEHHAAGGVAAGSSPEVMTACVTLATSWIGVGSGTVLLNHHSPFRIAETFRLLHGMFSGRIDLGLGHAGASPLVNLALQRDRSRPTPARRLHRTARRGAQLA